MLFAAIGLAALPWRIAIERRLREETERMRHLAHHDPLTGLPNRILLDQQLDGAIARAARQKTQVAFLAIDLDHFKPVNDTHGHDAGDDVLRSVAATLAAAVRAGDLAARIGGDEFAIVQEGGEQPFAAMLLAERISERLRQELRGDERMRGITASIGIAIHPDDSVDSAMLRRQADIALYRAKALGRDRCSIFAETDGESVVNPTRERVAAFG